MKMICPAAGLVTLVAAGCAAPPSPTPARPAASTVSDPAARDAGGPWSALPAPTTPRHAEPVGIASFAPPRIAATADLENANVLLQAGKVNEATTLLDQALALGPTYTEARFALARAHARAGDFAGAGRELTRVFEEDFVGMRAQAAEDADLRSFWSSTEGMALASRKDDYEARYGEVLARGVRVIVRKGRLLSFADPEVLRVGVLDPLTNRFVATAPPLPRAIHAFAPPNLPYAVVVTGAVRSRFHVQNRRVIDAAQTLETFSFFPFDVSGVPLARLDVGHVEAKDAALSLADRQVELELHTLNEVAPPAIHDARYQLTFGKLVSRDLLRSPAVSPAGYEPFKVHIDVGYNLWGATMDASDARYTARPDAVTLPTGETMAIPADLAFRHEAPRVIPDATGEHVVLLWDAETRQCDGHTIPGRYKLALVTRSQHTVTSLGEGVGPAAATFDPSGQLYVQRENGVFRIDPGSGAETALGGLFYLTEPVSDHPSCHF